jgi:metallophosphoesterase (TIGR03767 family)
MVVAPAVLLNRSNAAPARDISGTTLQSAILPVGLPGYRRLRETHPWTSVVRLDLAPARHGREDRRRGLVTVVQLTDLHVTDVQNPMRFEYLDRLNRTSHRPQELLGPQATAALVRRVNGLVGGPFTGRPVDAVMTTGDNTDNQAGTELEWVLTLLAGGVVRPNSGAGDGFDGVAGSGLSEYWQPDSPTMDRYKARGFPYVPGLLDAATKSFESPGLDAPWLFTMGNHDVVANGMLGNRPYVESWCTGDRKVFSAQCDASYRLAARLATVRAGDDVGDLLEDVARAGETRQVQADAARCPVVGEDYVRLLHDPRFTGSGPVGHGYDAAAGADRLYYSYELAPGVLAVSLDTTNLAGGFTGSVGAGQLAWLTTELERAADKYVIVFSHHPSTDMDNLAPDPRVPGERRNGGRDLADVLHRFPNVMAWVNGHTHKNRITPHRHKDPRRSFWEINTASHVDAPQQARVIELGANDDGTVSLFTTMVDAESPAAAAYDDLSPAGLASLCRELAYNDLAYLDRSGRREDRNTELLLVDPLS